ncbi:MAG: type I-E CRISPR-associated protein Cas7/Cse4/CasC [Anaerolineae bacterium]|jgi:CRISPR system Cascade subunit CasC|nr:type I-E CRISPR-associated protein Cas7/Cse4/CasC [Anaerolineae bacterium]
MLIEVHAIQSFGPTNLNRDDTGNPKEALFGGVRRARISSQAAKRALRVSPIFEREVAVPTGRRTKLLIGRLEDILAGEGIPADQASAAAAATITAVFASPDKKDAKKTNVLVFISDDEMQLLADYALSAVRDGKPLDEKALKNDLTRRLKGRRLAPDIALFGRMLADNPSVSVEAACQVAHALSTHEVNTEFDYFTAVDDLQPGEESGAGMLGLVAFNSATYYRCARLDHEQLVANLGDDGELARRTIAGFLKAFALVVPSGKQNSFVNQHAPDFLLAVVRPDHDGQSLDNAFERPVRARGGGYVEPSIHALAQYWEAVDPVYRLSQPRLAVLNPRRYELPSAELMAAMQPDLRAWVGAVMQALAEAQG